MTISVDLVCDGTALILSYPTGIMYSAQCGGIGCQHPKCEGFVLSLGTFCQDFDDCSYGCHHIEDLSEDSKKKLADDINDALEKQTSGWIYSIRFDFKRINQLMEGWWPVLVYGELDKWNNLSGSFEGFIHTGNCD